MPHVDTLLHASWIAPVEPDAALIDHSLAIADGRIAAVLPRAEAETAYTADHVHDLAGHLLIPGLVNAHTHSPMTLFRGLADDLPLGEWLNDHIWPAEGRFVSDAFVRDGTRLAALEMIRGGTTCFADMYFFPDEVARVAIEAGIRAAVGLIVIDFPTVWARDADEYIAKGCDVHDQFRDDPLVATAFAPHAPYTVSDAPLRRVGVLAEELDIPIHLHVHETEHEVTEAVAKNGRRPIARLGELGLLGPRLMAVHMTALDEDDIAAVAKHGVRVVHCPESNLKLASGICPTARLADAGVTLALGTDGAASNNDLDMVGEMRSAALLAKVAAGAANALPSHAVLRMATLGGAMALGLDEEIGTLAAGKSADVVAVDLRAPETQPLYDPISQLVYAACREQVAHVWVAGRHLLAERECLTLDQGAVLARARDWQRRIREEDAR